MNRPSVGHILLLGPVVIGLACIDVGEIHNPEDSGAAGAAGTAPSGGSAGAGGGGAASGVDIHDVGITVRNCPGCARLSVPLAAADVATTFFTSFEPTDLTDAGIILRVCKLSGTSGTLRLFAQDDTPGSGRQYLSQTLATVSNCGAGFQTLVMDLAPIPGGFDPTQTAAVGITVASDPSGPWDNPTVLLIDSVRAVGGGARVGPWTFDGGVSPFLISPDQSVAGSTLTWAGPQCPGCAALSAPLAIAERATAFAIDLGAPFDLTGAQVTFRLCTLTGTWDGYAEPYIQSAALAAGPQRVSLTAIPSCLVGFEYLDLIVHPVAGIDPTQVTSIGLRIGSGASGPWADPSVVLVDSILVSSGVVGPWTFDRSSQPFSVSPVEALPDSAAYWFGPAPP